jgi:hypothetical protein
MKIYFDLSSKADVTDCTVDLWYDAQLKLFVCKIQNGTVAPKMSHRYCANPTECGFEERHAQV